MDSISLYTALSAETPCQKQNCSDTSILWWCKCWLNCQNITISNILKKPVSSDIGL